MLLPVRSAVIWVWLVLMAASAVGTVQQPTSSAAAPSAAITVTDKDNSKDIDLTAGQTLIVKLQGNPSTGYAWSVSGDPAPLKLTKSYHERNKSGMAGAPQVAVLRFVASSPGVTNLTLVYRRSWEYNVAPAKTFSIRVNVR